MKRLANRLIAVQHDEEFVFRFTNSRARKTIRRTIAEQCQLAKINRERKRKERKRK